MKGPDNFEDDLDSFRSEMPEDSGISGEQSVEV